MASPTQNFTRRLYHGAGAPLSVGTTLAAYALALATMFGAALLVGGDRVGGAAAEVVGLGLVPLAIMRVHEVAPAHLGLRRPRLRAVVGGVVCGAGLWLLALHAAAPVVEWTARDQAVRAWSTGLFADRPSLALVIVTMVIVPSVSEELTHRGLLAGGLAPAIGRPLAIALSTLAFAVLHIEPARMVATAILGGAAGVLAMRGGSIWPAVALHATNNLIVALIGAGALPAIAAAIDHHAGLAVAAAAALTLAGGALAWTGTIAQPLATDPSDSGTVTP